MAKVRFLGHSAFYMEMQGYKMLVDPFLTGNPKAAVEESSFSEIDWIFLTHGHGDHLGDTVAIAKRTDATVVCNHELSVYLSGKGVKTMGMHIGGRTRMPWGRIKLTPALHGSGISEGDCILCGGNPCGFLFESDGKKIYHAGDTGLSVDMQLLGEEGIDLALLPIGGHFTMDVEDAVRALKMIKPRVAVPMHYDTFPPIQADPREFVKLASGICEVRVMEPGEVTEI